MTQIAYYSNDSFFNDSLRFGQVFCALDVSLRISTCACFAVRMQATGLVESCEGSREHLRSKKLACLQLVTVNKIACFHRFFGCGLDF